MSESKIARCIDIIKYNPHPSTEQIHGIMADVGCKQRTVYRAMKVVRDANERKANEEAKAAIVAAKKASRKKPKKGQGRKLSHNPNKAVSSAAFQPTPSKPKIPLIRKDMSFPHFCKYHSFPFYNGLYRWQVDWFKTIWQWKYSLTLVSRDHGKSIGHSNICQWVMSAKNYDILYLGWTSRRRDIAQFVYNFFLQRDELVIDKASSPYHFKTIYGTRFDTFSVKSKEILGKHEVGTLDREIIDENRYLEDFLRDSENPLLMIIDDAIDDTFWKERHKEEDLERFFQSTIANINPDKMMTVGTKKFEKDFYQFIQDVYEEDLIVYKRTPFLDPTDKRYGQEEDNPSNLLCPERWIHHTHPQYDQYLDLHEQIKLGKDPKTFVETERALLKLKDLTKKRKIAGEYWWSAEYMQDPHPITGEIWDKVHNSILGFSGTAFYDLACISIDRATTTGKKSDETGITMMFREKEIHYRQDAEGKEIPIHNYLVTQDLTQKIRITDLIALIDNMYESFMTTYRGVIRLVIVVEKQGGGDDFIVLAEDMGKRWAHLIIPVHNTRNKWDRIEDNLGTPIQTAEILFINALNTSKLVTQILTAPYSQKIDAIDSLSNGYYECEKLPQVNRNAKENVERLKHHRQETEVQKKSWETLAMNLLKQNRRSVF